MKIAHCTAWYYPSHTGGTEAYVKALTGCLRALGFPSVILVPGDVVSTGQIDGITVIRYLARDACKRMGINAATAFRTALQQSAATVLHLHSWTPDAGIEQLRIADSLGLSSLLTLHLPASLCLRGTMVFHGREACTVAVSHRHCAPCYLQSKNRSRWMQLAWPALSAALPRRLAKKLATIRPMLDTVGLVTAMSDDLNEAVRLCRQIVAVSEWQRTALIRNGIPAEKITLCRQGLTHLPPAVLRTATGATVRIGFVGRITPVKGLHVLIAALQKLSGHLPIELVIHGTASDGEIESYEAPLRQAAVGDARIRFAGHLPPAQIFEALAQLDVLAVPSQCQETGPLVALEAAAAGVPVLGSNLGGIAEWLQAGLPGWEIPFDDTDAWCAALLRLVRGERPAACPDFRVRTNELVAAEMAALYRHLPGPDGLRADQKMAAAKDNA